MLRNAMTRGLLASVAVSALLAVGAGAASAQSWSPLGAQKWTGDITLTPSSGASVTCEDVEIVSQTIYFGILLDSDWSQTWPCAGGTTFGIDHFYASPSYTDDNGDWVVAISNYDGTSPWGAYEGVGSYGGQFEGTWTNGSGGTPSRITFANADIGSSASQSIRLSGTLDATTDTGGIVTLD